MIATGSVAAPDTSSIGARQTTDELLRARAGLPAGDPDRTWVRNQAVLGMLPLANRLARRYARHGEPVEDLAQVAAPALVKAVDGYDPDRLTPFAAYAVPTIVGALKRHFRDSAWGMHVPRAVKQLLLDLRVATGDLEQRGGHTPTSGDLAAHLGVDTARITDALNASQVYRLLSFDPVRAGDRDDAQSVGVTDPRFADIDERLSHGLLGRLVQELPPRERRILAMRFSDEMTQSSIAGELGISQMHVSRLLKHSLHQIAAGILTSPGEHDERRKSPPDRIPDAATMRI
jgi:RNA polymerase sigma-B factor